MKLIVLSWLIKTKIHITLVLVEKYQMNEVIQTVMALQKLSIREFSFHLENVPFRTP